MNLIMFVFITWMWVMVNQVRQDIRDKRNTDMGDKERDVSELSAMDETSLGTDHRLEESEDIC